MIQAEACSLRAPLGLPSCITTTFCEQNTPRQLLPLSAWDAEQTRVEEKGA